MVQGSKGEKKSRHKQRKWMSLSMDETKKYQKSNKNPMYGIAVAAAVGA